MKYYNYDKYFFGYLVSVNDTSKQKQKQKIIILCVHYIQRKQYLI